MNTLRPFSISLAAVAVLFYLAACRFDRSGLPATEAFYSCQTSVTHYGTSNQPLDAQVGGASQTKSYVINKGFGDTNVSTKPAPIYWDNTKFVVQAYGSGSLKGSIQIETGYNDWSNTTPAFLYVQILYQPEGFYLAYDSRANPKPSWLTKDYQTQIDPATGQPDAITISMTDQNANPPAYVKMQIWRRVSIPANHLVIVPGNSYGDVGWGYVKKGTPAMYIAFIKPKSQVDYSKPDYDLQPQHDDVPAYTQADAEAAAGQDCKAKYGADPNLRCGKPACDYKGDTGAQQHPLTSFSQGSEIKFDKPSQANITIEGHTETYTSEATGTLYFDYLVTKHDLQLNSLILNFSPVDTAVGHFQNMAAILINQAQAHCKDGMPIYGQPCSHYEIAQGELIATESVLLDGKTIVWPSQNTVPIDVTINHASKSFSAKGTIQATIKINDQDTPMNIDLDLYGYFVNFAPVAKGEESTKFSECEENTNQKPVVLNAAGSFEIYLPDPTNLPRYEWYEDFGLVTEHLWGNQKVVTIPSHTLGYGVHRMTLLVGDTAGVVDTTTFDVTVADTTPPHLTVPPDITTDIYPAGTQSAQVDIGKAGASDACSSSATISNDAPANLLFPPGVTNVTWQADDNRGNVATAVQRVNVRLEENLIVQVVIGVIILFLGGSVGGFVVFGHHAPHPRWLTVLGAGSAAAVTIAGGVVLARPLLNRPGPPPPQQLQIEAIDMSVSGDYDRVYCYASLAGAPEVRLPERDFTFIQVSAGQGNIAEWAAGNRKLVVSMPKDGVLNLGGECWAWSGKTLHRLGPFAGKYPSETWDGARRPLEGAGFHIDVALKPVEQVVTGPP